MIPHYSNQQLMDSVLWFSSWVPASAGATVGVCIALFVFAIIERYLMAFRRACDVAWQKGYVFSVILPTILNLHTTCHLSLPRLIHFV